MAMLVFCALTSHKIYDRLTRHFRLDTTLFVGPLRLTCNQCCSKKTVSVVFYNPEIRPMAMGSLQKSESVGIIQVILIPLYPKSY